MRASSHNLRQACKTHPHCLNRLGASQKRLHGGILHGGSPKRKLLAHANHGPREFHARRDAEEECVQGAWVLKHPFRLAFKIGSRPFPLGWIADVLGHRSGGGDAEIYRCALGEGIREAGELHERGDSPAYPLEPGSPRRSGPRESQGITELLTGLLKRESPQGLVEKAILGLHHVMICRTRGTAAWLWRRSSSRRLCSSAAAACCCSRWKRRTSSSWP